MRNLTKTLVAVSLLTSTSVHSLGIGGIKLRSALNQRLNAEIALVTSGNENVGDIQVKLASPAKFDEAGVPWSYFLTKIKFTPITKADGSVGIKLSSDEALKEPYLDFLVEVTGPNGTLFREFTVLVDPPASYKKPAVPVITRATPKPRGYDEFDAPVRQVESSKPIREDEYQDTAIRAEHASGDYDSATGEYGPTQNSDTIWSIANQVKPDDISTEQMVMAIFNANRNAFAKPNVNKLLAGKILNIPSHDDVLRLARQPAGASFKHSGHRTHRGIKPVEHVVPHKPKQAAIASNEIKPVKHLKLNPPPVEAETTHAGVTDENGRTADHAAPNIDTTASAEDADLKQRFEKIEQQLQMMQKMLELKDAQLASLQKQQTPDLADQSAQLKLAEPVKTEPVVEVTPVLNPLADQPKVEVQPKPVTEVEPAPTPVLVPVAEVKPTVAPIAKPTPVVPTAPVNAVSINPFTDYYVLAGGIGASLLGALGLIWWRKRKVEKSIDTESMFASASQISLPNNDKESSPLSAHTSGYEVGTVGDSTFLSEFTPSEFDAFETDQTEIDPLSEADVYLAYGRYQQAEELIRQVIAEHPNRNDCKLKLLEIFHTSENKLEFDNYVQQLTVEGKQSDKAFWAKVVEMGGEIGAGSVAKSSMQESVAKPSVVNVSKPVEDEFDFDLNTFSESPVMTSRVTNLDNTVKPVLQAAAAASDIFLDKKPETTSGIEFGSSRFGGSLESNDFVDEKAISDLDFELSNYESTAKDFITDEADIQDLTFDLASFGSQTAVAEDDIEYLVEDDGNGLDFDLDGLNQKKGDITDDSIEYVDEDELNALDFNLDTLDSFKTSRKTEQLTDKFQLDLTATETKKGQSVDFDFSDELDESVRDLDFSATALNTKSANVEMVSADELNEVEDFNFDFDFNLPAGDVDDKLDKAFDKLDVSDLTDTENVFETKVNLANAYVDMGDVDAAKVIANDLLKGNAEQKKAGQEILEKIS